MNEPMIRASAVRKSYRRSLLSGPPRRVDVLRGIDLVVPRGAFYGLVGESGSGKSTLARVLVGMEAPTSGSVLLDGVDPSAVRGPAAAALRLRCPMVFQDARSALDPLMSAAESVEEALRAAGAPRAERSARVDALLESVLLDPALGRRLPAELSGGQRQRVVIARALACDPAFVLLDEPVSSLDVSVQAGIVDLLLDLRERRGLTYVLVSHDLALVTAVCGRVAVMKDGLVVEEGDARDLAAAPRHRFTAELHGRSLRLGARTASGESMDIARNGGSS